jgi:RNA recognition motif-containing protein
MAKKIYVGNLTFDATDAELRELFSPHGEVQSAQVVTDRDTGRSRGFGFVEMSDGADAAIAALNGQDFKGRSLTVNEAKAREGGGGRGGFRMGGGGGGGSRRGGFRDRRY